MRYKQSSDCEASSLRLLLTPAARPALSLPGLHWVVLVRSGMFCGQTGRNLLASSVSLQGATVTGGMNRRLPSGGVAKGMPRKVATGWRLSAGWWRTPCTGPYLVATFLKTETSLSADNNRKLCEALLVLKCLQKEKDEIILPRSG